jgi:hypothetical protein
MGRSIASASFPVKGVDDIRRCCDAEGISGRLHCYEIEKRMLGFSPAPNRGNTSVRGKETYMRIALTVVAILSFSMTLVAAEPFVGTWKLNVEKSKPTGNNVDLASETMTISKTGPSTFRTAIESVSKSGQTRHQEINRIYDGKEHPVSGVGIKQEGATEIDLLVGASTRKMTVKRDGKAPNENISTVSPDGRV